MGLLRMSVIGGAVLSVSAAGALAADMPGDRTLAPPASLSKYSEPESEPFAGWYLRGDIGYSWLKSGSAEAANGFLAPTSGKLNNNINASIGAGIKSGWLRSDITVDFIPATSYSGQVVTPGDTTAKVTATTILLNGYLDLGSWYRMTPYVGVGAGTANMHISNFVSAATPPFASNSSRSQWNFAWAGMAGVAYSISPNVMVDFGYRYVSLGDVRTQADAFGSFKLKNIAAHEVRVGLRWNFEDAPLGR
jgi:opacity protein-like surface antigen